VIGDVLLVTETTTVLSVTTHPKDLDLIVNVLKVGWTPKTVPPLVLNNHIQKD
jgi:hypothetical protein